MARERGINKTHQCCTGSPRSAPSHGNHSNRSGACCCPCPRAVPRTRSSCPCSQELGSLGSPGPHRSWQRSPHLQGGLCWKGVP